MKTSWNDAEDDALQGLPLRAQIIYLRGIRRFMSYKTGISGGVERRICLKGLSEVAEAYFNRQREQPNKKEVIVSIDQLKKAGLLERIEDKDYLIFFLPLADWDKSEQNNHGTTTAQPRHNHGTECGTEKPSNNAACDSNSDTPENDELFPPTGTTAHIRLTGKPEDTCVVYAHERIPENGMKWVEYFVNQKGFQIPEAQTAKSVPMFVSWVNSGVTIGDVELAMIKAHDVLNGGKPTTPVYYRNFVDAVMIEKQKSPNPAANRNSGFKKQPQQRPDYSSLWESDGAIDSTSTVINNEPARL